MDIAQPLSTLRRLLEAQLNISLHDYEFWLQDSIKVQLCFFGIFMAALRSRCGHYIFALWFLLFLLSSFFIFLV